MMLPLETRKRILAGLGWKAIQREGGEWKLLRPNGDYYGSGLQFYSESDALLSSDSVPIDANFCEREIIPYLRQRNQSVVIAVHNGTGGRYRVAIDREEHEHHVYLGDESSSTKVDFAVTRDSLSTAIALAFNSYLEAQP